MGSTPSRLSTSGASARRATLRPSLRSSARYTRPRGPRPISSLRTNRDAFGDDAEGAEGAGAADDAEEAESAEEGGGGEAGRGELVAKRRMGVGPWPASRVAILFSTSRKPRSSASIFL